MTRNKFVPSVRIHPILLIFIIISFLTGTFIELIVILTIVMFHELGHYIMASAFNWRIRGIMLWVFGGVMDTDEYGTRPFHQEMLVTIAGPFQHVFIYIMLFLISGTPLLPDGVIEIAMFYNTVILLFNLLPIWPLDGGKLLFLMLSSRLPYRRAYEHAIIGSISITLLLVCVQLLFVPFTFSALLLFIFLLIENRTNWKQRFYVFLRFLLRRYKGENYIKRVQTIEVPYHCVLMDVFNQFQRDKRHIIYVTHPGESRQAIDEMDCLHNYFHEQRYYHPVGEIADFVS